MSYFISTTFRDCEGSYGEHQDVPFQGACQGNGYSPETWLLISIYHVLLMKNEVHVSNTNIPMSGIVLILVGLPLVGDTDLMVLDEKRGRRNNGIFYTSTVHQLLECNLKSKCRITQT